MKKWLPLLLIASFALNGMAHSATITAPGESSQVEAWSDLLLLVGQLVLVIVAILVALAWIWFPFMVKKRLDKIIHRLDSVEQLLSKQASSRPDSP